jgi:hypothetical protein
MSTIQSRLKWNKTGVKVIAGRNYRYRAIGRWKDWHIECDADGFTNAFMDLSGWLKRAPSAKWFQLIGAVDRDSSRLINLGTSGKFTAPSSGTLWAFANDASFAYGNNSGHVDLSVEEDD